MYELKWVIHFVIGKVKTCHLTSVRVKRHLNRVFSSESLSIRNMERSTAEEYVKIIKFYYKKDDSAANTQSLTSL